MSDLLHLWHTRTGSIASGELTFRALRDFFGIIPGCNKTSCFSVGSKGVSRVYLLSTEISQSQEYGYRILTDWDLIQAFLTSAEQVAQIVEKVGREIEQISVSTATDLQLAEAFQRSNEVLTALYGYYHLSNREFSDFVSKSIHSWLEPRVFSPRDVSKCLMAGDTTCLKTFQEIDNWLSIVETYYDRNQDITCVRHQIIEHAIQYGFLGIDENHHSGLNVKDYIQRLLATQSEELLALRFRVEETQRQATSVDKIAQTCGKRIVLPDDLLTACRSIAHISISRLRLREASLFHYRACEPLMIRIYDVIDKLIGYPTSEYLKEQLTI